MHFLQSKADLGLEFASIWEHFGGTPGKVLDPAPSLLGGAAAGGLEATSKRPRNDSGSGAGKIAYGMVLLVFFTIKLQPCVGTPPNRR